MSPITHFFSGWVLANCVHLERRDRALITIAAVIPDIDGLGLIPEWLTANSPHPLMWFTRYHHSLHTLPFAFIVTALAFVVARYRWLPAIMVFLSFHVHLLEDLLGSRGPDGYQWPIPYLKPFSSWEISWSGQWALNDWRNVVITAALLFISLYLARQRGYSFIEMFSRRADVLLVTRLRERFPIQR